MKSLDIYAWSPLKFRTWLGVFCSLITYTLIGFFAYIEVVTLMPRLMEAAEPQFMIGWVDSSGATVAIDATYGTWKIETISWETLNPAGYVVESSQDLASCGDNKFCMYTQPVINGATNKADGGSNTFISFVPCTELGGADCKTGSPLTGYLGTLSLETTFHSDVIDLSLGDFLTQRP